MKMMFGFSFGEDLSELLSSDGDAKTEVKHSPIGILNFNFIAGN